jgi:NAD(P)-dependent dehydrogenase (short-subunit alcohol dehydrogenase family)
MDRFSLAGNVAVVTGGAGGIGRAIAIALGEADARVIAADVSAQAATRVADELAERGLAVVGRSLDVSDGPGVDAFFGGVVSEFGRVHVLVNCAGIAERAPATEVSVESWDKVMRVNATGTFLCCRAAARHMEGNGGGAIVNIASIMGLSGGGLYPNVSYQTSKGAVVNMTRALALEWAKKGIRVNAVAPTYVRTDFIKPLTDNPVLHAALRAMTPLGRLAEPEDVASAVLYLASPAAAMVTGHILAVDGGFLAQ